MIQTIPMLRISPANTSVLIIGAGATGSHISHRLGMFFASLSHNSEVTSYIDIIDLAAVREANLIRQVHNIQDIGTNKALALAANITNAFGVKCRGFSSHHQIDINRYEIVFCCVDSYEYRMSQERDLHCFYIDCGNGKDYGQVISGYPIVSSLFKDYNFPPLPKTEPSCTLQEAIGKQSLFVNAFIADIAMLHLLSFYDNQSKPDWYGLISFMDLPSITVKTKLNSKYVFNRSN